MRDSSSGQGRVKVGKPSAAEGTAATASGRRPAKTPVPKGVKVKRGATRRATPGKEGLLVRLEGLRSDAREITRAYLAGIDRAVLDVIDFVNAAGSEGGRKGKDKDRVVERMLKTLEDLEIKPEKGRRKDLKRIESLVQTLSRLAIPDQGKA